MTNDRGSAAPPPSRLVVRRRTELLALCRAGQVAHAVDLAFEHLAAHGPDPALLCQLSAARGGDDLDPAVRRRLDELIRTHHPDLGDEPDPCAALTVHHGSVSTPGSTDPSGQAPRR